MRAEIKSAGIVHVTQPDQDLIILFADRGVEAESLRRQAESFRERAARLLAKAALYDDAADRLS